MMAAGDDFRSRFAATLEAGGLLQGVRRLGLAVSGGSDSIALMRLLAPECARRGIAATVLCFDHAIVGENSAAEAAFVRASAAALGLPCRLERADPPVAPGRGESLEMAARRVRQVFFARAAADLGLDAVATGHQRDDVAETLLLRLLRGAGATGLSGLRPLSPAAGGRPAIIRPLLSYGRDELRDFLRAEGTTWMDDVANTDEAIPRCRVRRRALPTLAGAMGEETKAISRALAQSADILRQEDAFLDGLARDWLERRGILADARNRDSADPRADEAASPRQLPIKELAAEPLALARRVARLWLEAQDKADAAGFAAVERLLAGSTPAVNLSDGAIVDIRDGAAVMRAPAPPAAPPPETTLTVPGDTRWGDFVLTVSDADKIARERDHLGAFPAACTLSRASLGGRPLTVRGRLPGDKIRPLGLNGGRKVQDVFVDGRVPAADRDAYPLVLCGGEIAWIPGYRVAAAFAAKSGEPLVGIAVRREPRT